MRSFNDQCIVITGAAGGLGQALVTAFLHAHANVVALDRDGAALQALQNNTTVPPGATLMTALCDVTTLPSCEAAIGQAITRFGGVDVLINNAGIAHRSAFADTQMDVLRRVMEVNFFGAVNSKHALHGFFDSLRTEVQDDGVDVLIVCPSFIDTGIDRAALGADGQPAAHARKTTGATTQPAEVATAILHAAQHQRQLLLFSFTAKAAWWLSRLWPTRYAAIMRKRLRAEIFPATTHASVETTP